ncbi:hypothetical protein D3C75_992740 [compost metagenome]
MYSVIIFVILAGGSARSPLRSSSTCPDTGSIRIADLTFKPRDSTEGICVVVVAACTAAGFVEVDSVCSPSANTITGAKEKHSMFSNITEATLLRRNCRFVALVVRFFSFSFNVLKLPSILFYCLVYSIIGHRAKKDRQNGNRPVCYGI